MLSVLATAWRIVAKRAASDWLILASALITIVLSTSLLAAGPIYADAVTLSGAHRMLADAPVTDANVEISLRTRPEDYDSSNAIVAAEVPQTFGATGGVISQRVVSESFELPVQPSEDFTDLAVFQSLGQIEEHAAVVDGAWPTRVDEPYETAILASTASLLGLSVGDELTVTNRGNRTVQIRVRIVGIFQVNDRNDPYWFDDELATVGVVQSSLFRTYGPFLVDLESMWTGLSPINAEVNWRVFPNYENLAVSRISEMRRRVQGLEERLNSNQRRGLAFIVETRVIRMLSDVERSLLATRSGVVTLTVQMAILAGYALLLTARLLVESRRIETNLLRSRGASGRQILTMAAMEGAVLTLPAALLAPWLAVLTLRTLNSVGPLASIGLTINPVVTRSGYVLSLVAAVGCVIALVAPAHFAAPSFTDSYVARGREQTRGLIQRGGFDFALLTFAAIAFWQLRRYGAQITSTVQGRLGIDPLLVAAPALGLLAGAVLALRSIPLIAKIAEKSAAAGTSVVRALSAWQVARRPVRHSRSALLLILAISIGLLAATYTTTWKQSQEDQADHQIGADVRVSPNRRINDSIPELNLQQAHGQLEGLEESMPVARRSGQVAQGAGIARFVMLDASQAGEVVQIRDDLTARPFVDMMAELESRRPSLATLPLQGEPLRIALEVSVDLEALPETFTRPAEVLEARLGFAPIARVVLQDGNGLLHRVPLGAIPVDAGRVRLAADLSYAMTNGAIATPTYPLSLVDIEIRSPAPFVIARMATIHIAGIFVDSGEPHSWREVDALLDLEHWALSHSELSPSFASPSIEYAAVQPTEGLEFMLNSGISAGRVPSPVSFGMRPVGTELLEEVPTVVSDGFLRITDSDIGDEIQLSNSLLPDGSFVIIGTVASFPTVDPGLGEAVLLDLPTVQMMTYQTGSRITPVDERWIGVEDGRAPAVADQLLLEPYETLRVNERVDRADALQSDPVALGTIGSLSIGFVAATLFAAVGFTASAVVSARERITEFALLRAVGLSSRQLAWWLSLEHGVLVVLSLIFGSLIGLGLAWLILPFIAITQDATTAVPAVIVAYPWNTIMKLELLVIAVLAAIVAVLAAVFRRLGLGSLLRLGED